MAINKDKVQKWSADDLLQELKSLGKPGRATGAARYFKTGKGQYGYGDVFLGVTVPEQRKLAKKFSDLPMNEIKKMIHHQFHECRLTAIFILVNQYKKAGNMAREKIVEFYLNNKKYVNNWDLVDSSAPYILGNFLLDKPKDLLYELAVSANLWDRRMAIISTQAFITENKFSETLKIAKLLLDDQHDLIHKAVGWMLREVGKKSVVTEKQFLEKHAAKMPRTMLRYAIEKFALAERQKYLAYRTERNNKSS